jgi:hypothetical protein
LNILILFYHKIRTAIEEYNSASSFSDKIKIYVFHDIVDGKYLYLTKLFDKSEIPVGNIILENFYNVSKVIPWQYTSLSRDFLYFEELNYFLCSLILIIKKPDTLSLFDLIVVVSNSFGLSKKLMMESPFSNSMYSSNS